MAVTIAELDKALARWQSKLKRAVNTIDKLQKRRKRLVVRAETLSDPKPVKAPAKAAPAPLVSVPPADDLTVPDFLKRTSKPASDAAVAEQIKAEQAAIKKAKAAGRIAKMKAKQSGETKKMPLTGKAALDAIRNG